MKTWKLMRNKLPKYTVPEHCWKNIETILDALETNCKQEPLVGKLPKYSAPNLLEVDIEKAPPFVLKAMVKWSAAAILLLSIGVASIHLSTAFFKISTIAYSTEALEGKQKEGALFNIEDQGNVEAMLAQACRRNPSVCENEEFQRLKQELQTINQEIGILEIEYEKYSDAQIQKHLIRITNDKLKIEQFLYKLIK
jgi:hypothetical protein